LFKAAGADGDRLRDQLAAVSALAADPGLRQFADSPKTEPSQVFDLMAGVALQKGLSLDVKIGNLLRAVLDNGRLPALPEIASQFTALVNAQGGVSDALIESPYPIEGLQLAEVVATLEKRFARKLNAAVRLVPELIGGIRVIVGDEVLDTSVKARLEQMKVALTA
jgi:F-type H+-transporting ATPase subunit delta